MTQEEQREILALVKHLVAERGYHFETDPDGTERMIRPDGSVAIIAKPKAQK